MPKTRSTPPSSLGRSLPTDSAPAEFDQAVGRLARHHDGLQDVTLSFTHNANKSAEYGLDSGAAPQEGAHREMPSDEASGSTLTENRASDKLGAGVPPLGDNPNNGSLDRVRVDSADRGITTNQGLPVADNQHSLKAGARGPVLLEDFILREKISHFDHERIPERVVHARGSAAHGTFVCTEALGDVTKADLFSVAGKETPVFVRFSTVAGERGSADTVRDTRGFAVKFYTDEGNWDLVGNNIPVFFIQDAMKFPDVVHAVKPEPHNGMPQASSAHDTFWDFISLMPESIHHTLWAMSDRGIPRSYRMMQGFGVHTFRLVDEDGNSNFVKFHWQPHAGTHALIWDEAIKIAGCDADFHRRDLWESIELGLFPKWDLALQVFSEEQAERFTFDVLDPTKIVPEELVPLRVVGTLTLNRNPDNFFAETEQVAFCTSHVVPGIDFSNDPLLQGRLFSYQDTQLTRLGGPNFHEIPINAPVAQVHNNQRDGMHRQSVHRGAVSYEPNSLGGGCPFQAGMAGFRTLAEPVREHKARIKPEKFADHYSQATLFFASQTPIEKQHITNAFVFELTRVKTPAIRQRVISVLRNVDDALAEQVALGLGMPLPEAQPVALEPRMTSEVEASPGLSMFARPGVMGPVGRQVALVVADGCDGAQLAAVRDALLAQQVWPRVVGLKPGETLAADGTTLEAQDSITAKPSVLWDGSIIFATQASLPAMTRHGPLLEFIRDQFRHCKTMMVVGESATLLHAAGVAAPAEAEPAVPGVLTEPGENGVARFLAALSRHRHFEREIDPPPV
jgi:catalase